MGKQICKLNLTKSNNGRFDDRQSSKKVKLEKHTHLPNTCQTPLSFYDILPCWSHEKSSDWILGLNTNNLEEVGQVLSVQLLDCRESWSLCDQFPHLNGKELDIRKSMIMKEFLQVAVLNVKVFFNTCFLSKSCFSKYSTMGTTDDNNNCFWSISVNKSLFEVYTKLAKS